MFTGFDFDVIQRSFVYLFRDGMTFTLTLTAIAMAGGIVFGTLLAMMRLSSFRPVAAAAGAYVNLMRSLPLVLVIFWFYFLVPWIGGWLMGDGGTMKVGAFLSAATLIYLLTNIMVVFAMRVVERKVRVPGYISAGGAPQAGH